MKANDQSRNKGICLYSSNNSDKNNESLQVKSMQNPTNNKTTTNAVNEMLDQNNKSNASRAMKCLMFFGYEINENNISLLGNNDTKQSKYYSQNKRDEPVVKELNLCGINSNGGRTSRDKVIPLGKITEKDLCCSSRTKDDSKSRDAFKYKIKGIYKDKNFTQRNEELSKRRIDHFNKGKKEQRELETNNRNKGYHYVSPVSKAINDKRPNRQPLYSNKPNMSKEKLKSFYSRYYNNESDSMIVSKKNNNNSNQTIKGYASRNKHLEKAIQYTKEEEEDTSRNDNSKRFSMNKTSVIINRVKEYEVKQLEVKKPKEKELLLQTTDRQMDKKKKVIDSYMNKKVQKVDSTKLLNTTHVIKSNSCSNITMNKEPKKVVTKGNSAHERNITNSTNNTNKLSTHWSKKITQRIFNQNQSCELLYKINIRADSSCQEIPNTVYLKYHKDRFLINSLNDDSDEEIQPSTNQ